MKGIQFAYSCRNSSQSQVALKPWSFIEKCLWKTKLRRFASMANVHPCWQHTKEERFNFISAYICVEKIKVFTMRLRVEWHHFTEDKMWQTDSKVTTKKVSKKFICRHLQRLMESSVSFHSFPSSFSFLSFRAMTQYLHWEICFIKGVKFKV